MEEVGVVTTSPAWWLAGGVEDRKAEWEMEEGTGG